MGLRISSFLLLHLWVFLVLSLGVSSQGSEVALKLLRTPHPFSNRNFAAFSFQVLVSGINGSLCTDCSTICKLDLGKFSACEGRNVSYSGLLDGNHSFEVCTNGTSRFACANYNWTVDTVSPTANVTVATPFTSASRVWVNISFSEPCGFGGGFRCPSINACNLLVYGEGEVLPDTLNIVQPNMTYSIAVHVSERARYGRLVLVMDKSFCKDAAGNQFTRTENSSFILHFDRRSVFANMRTHIPERLLQINNETRTVLATNKNKSLKVYLYFSGPVMNTSADILTSLTTNQGSFIAINGSTLGQRRFGYQSFQKITWSNYIAHIQADTSVISVNVPENITTDVSGNRNKGSNTLQVMHYSVPVESFVISSVATAAFAVTALISGFLTLSTASLLSVGAFSRPNAVLFSDPARNLFRIASHVQVFALSKWLALTLPIEYYELVRGLQWSIPYFNLPWEKEDIPSLMVGSTSPKDPLNHAMEAHDSIVFQGLQPIGSFASAAKAYGLPLTPMEYTSYFESLTMLPEAEHILDPQTSHGWRDFSRSMFWLAVIGGGLILLHILLVMILKFRKKGKEKESYGALVFPRFEIFLLLLALPCLSVASAALIQGGTTSGIVIGVLIVSLVALVLLSLLFFLSYGITFGKLLQYKEVHRVGEEFHWYHELIRVTLGPGKRGQWTWKNDQRSIYLTILGPLFEDLRGPPKYMVSQIAGAGGKKPTDRIIASDDETEDAEAPCIQKLFGILRIYYTLIEAIKRVALGIVAGAYSKSWSVKTPMLTMLCITSFQLFFMVLKKPFIKKKVQLVELVSVSCELAIFTFCYVISEHDFSVEDERKLGISMLLIFLFAFIFEIINEWYALFTHTKQLDPLTNSFMHGLETASIGFALFICPHSFVGRFKKRFPINNTGETDTASVNRSSGSRSSGDKPWLKQIREMARSSFSREGKGSRQGESSTHRSRWSELLKGKRSGSSSAASTDFKPKQKGLHKELEDIFASK